MSRMYNRRKKTHVEAGESRCGKNCHISEQGRTRDIIAKELGVSPRTITHAFELGNAIETLGEMGEPIKEKIQKGERIIKKDVMAAAKAKDDGDDFMAAKILKHGTKVPVVIVDVPSDVDGKLAYIFEQAKWARWNIKARNV